MDSADDSIAAAVEDHANQWGVGTSFLEDSFSSVIGQFGADAVRSTPLSTPVKAPPAQPRRRATTAIPIDRLPCPQCKKTFANARTLAVHAKMHAMSSMY